MSYVGTSVHCSCCGWHVHGYRKFDNGLRALIAHTLDEHPGWEPPLFKGRPELVAEMRRSPHRRVRA